MGTVTETMNPINAGLWSIAGFDPACQLLAELRELLHSRYPNDHQLLISCDRMLSVYLEAQCDKLRTASGMDHKQADTLITGLLRGEELDNTIRACTGLTEDPLLVEIAAYAMHLGGLTAHGTAPWRRFATIISACVDEQVQAAAATLETV